jgi:hypothetical protein
MDNLKEVLGGIISLFVIMGLAWIGWALIFFLIKTL